MYVLGKWGGERRRDPLNSGVIWVKRASLLIYTALKEGRRRSGGLLLSGKKGGRGKMRKFVNLFDLKKEQNTFFGS